MNSKIKLLPFPMVTNYGAFCLFCVLVLPLLGVLFGVHGYIIILALAIVLGALLLLALKSYTSTRSFLKQVDFKISVDKKIFSGVKAKFIVNLNTPIGFPIANLKLRPIFSKGLIPVDDSEKHLIVESNSSYKFKYSILPISRGEKEFKDIFGRISFRNNNPELVLPFGKLSISSFIRWQFSISLENPIKLKVLPNYTSNNDRNNSAFNGKEHGQNKKANLFSQGREFESLRKYSLGDPLSQVCWKSSAKGKGIFIKNYVPETHQRISIALDCGRRMVSMFEKRMQFEFATDAVARLTKTAIGNSDQVELFAFSHRINAKIPSNKGSRQENRIIESLYSLEAGNLESDYDLVREWATGIKKRTLLILITSIYNPHGLEQIRKIIASTSKYHVPLVISVKDLTLENLSLEKPTSIEESYIISSAMQQVSNLQKYKNIFKKSGISLFYSSATDLQQVLTSKYREIKLSGRL